MAVVQNREMGRQNYLNYYVTVDIHDSYFRHDGFGGRVVSMLASGTQVQTRPKPLDFSGVKILSMPSSGEEVKESVQCPSFAACQRT